MKVGDLGPGVEGWGETEGWRQERKRGVSMISPILRDSEGGGGDRN